MSRRDMDEDINWGKLFLKVIIFFVIVLLIIWLLSKFILKKSSNTDNNKEFEANLKKMSEVAEKYYEDETKLPKEGESSTITLKEMITDGLITTLKDGKTTCSTKSSYAKVTNKNGTYTLKTLLTCGANSDYTSKVIKKTKKENNTETKQEENTTNNSSNNTNNNTTNETNNSNTNNKNNSNTTNQTTETITTKPVDTEYKFCKIGYKDYYVVATYNKNYLVNNNKYTYTITLNNINNISNISIIDDSYFVTLNHYKNINNDYSISTITEESGLENNDIIKNITNVYDIVKNSLKVSDFEYVLSDIYQKDGKYQIDVTITIKNNRLNGYSTNNKNLVFIPIYIRTSYADLTNCVTDKTSNRANYSEYIIVR